MCSLTTVETALGVVEPCRQARWMVKVLSAPVQTPVKQQQGQRLRVAEPRQRPPGDPGVAAKVAASARERAWGGEGEQALKHIHHHADLAWNPR